MKDNKFKVGEAVLARVIVKGIEVDGEGALVYRVGKELDAERLFGTIELPEDRLAKLD